MRNTTLNLLKAVTCCFVVIVHANVSSLTGIIGPCLIPIFFLISGYYSYRENEDNSSKILKSTYHILKLTGVSFLVYIVYSVIKYALDIDRNVTAYFLNRVIKNPLRFFLLFDFEFFNAGHLWFLPALLVAYIVLYFLVKKRIIQKMYFLIPVLFIVYAVVCTVFVSDWHFGENALRAVPYVLMGHYIASKRDKLKEWSNILTLGLPVLVIILIICLCIFLPENVANIIVVLAHTPIEIIISSLLFIFACNNPQAVNVGFINSIGDKYSMYIYIIHIIVLQLVTKLADGFGYDKGPSLHALILALLTIAVSLVLSIVIEYVLNNKIMEKTHA